MSDPCRIHYETKRGTRITRYCSRPDVEREILKLFRRRIEARAFANDVVIAEVWRGPGRHWNWYVDVDTDIVRGAGLGS